MYLLELAIGRLLLGSDFPPPLLGSLVSVVRELNQAFGLVGPLVCATLGLTTHGGTHGSITGLLFGTIGVVENLLVEARLGLSVGRASEAESLIGAQEVGDLRGVGDTGEEVSKNATVLNLREIN